LRDYPPSRRRRCRADEVLLSLVSAVEDERHLGQTAGATLLSSVSIQPDSRSNPQRIRRGVSSPPRSCQVVRNGHRLGM
jgi:hypothetical protein